MQYGKVAHTSASTPYNNNVWNRRGVHLSAYFAYLWGRQINSRCELFQIWSCGSCYSFFHLNCIQRWANDSTSLKKMNQELETGYYTNAGEYVPKQQKAIKWCCPKCRTDYAPSDVRITWAVVR